MIKKITQATLIFTLVALPFFSQASVMAEDLAGRILIQVEENGEAWYVDPVVKSRYYLGKPADAFELMREKGLGVSEEDYQSFMEEGTPRDLAGRILLRAEAEGQAYYVDPVKLRLHYLGEPETAFELMQILGLGITNEDLYKIPMVFDPNIVPIISDLEINMDMSEWIEYENGNLDIALQIPEEIYVDEGETIEMIFYPPGTEIGHEFKQGIYLHFDRQVKDSDMAIRDFADNRREKAEETGTLIEPLIPYEVNNLFGYRFSYVEANSEINERILPVNDVYVLVIKESKPLEGNEKYDSIVEDMLNTLKILDLNVINYNY